MAGFSGGTFTRTYDWTTDLAGGNATANVTASRMDTEHDGFATGLSTTICKDGQTTTTAVIPFAAGVRVSDGTVGTPGIHFTSDTDCGMRRSGTNQIALVTEGADRLTVGTATVAITGALSMTTPLLATYGGTGTGASANTCRITHNADQTTGTGAETDMSFNTEIHDGNSLHSTVTDNNRINIITTGTYAITGNVQYVIGATALSQESVFHIGIKADGTTYLARSTQTVDSGGSQLAVTLNVATIAQLNAGSYVTLFAAQTTGATQTVKATAGVSPIFAVARIAG